MFLRWTSALVLLVWSVNAQEWPGIRLQLLATGLGIVTDIQPLPDGTGRLFVLQKAGRIQLVSPGGIVQPEPVLTLPVATEGERGLVGVAFPPGFALKRYFYVSYTGLDNAARVSRFRLNLEGTRADPTSEELILSIARTSEYHYAGQVAFGPDGYLYISTGDSGPGDPVFAAQRGDELRGKILRIDTESSAKPYGIPVNPFTGIGVRGELWALGFRNPWRMSFDRVTGEMWVADVGHDRAEEVNVVEGGRNYGWRIIEGLQCWPEGNICDKTNLTLPLFEYTREIGQSVTGGYVYRGSRDPLMQGLYIFGDFGSGRIFAARRNGQYRELLDTDSRITTFGQDTNGELYMGDARGNLYAIVSATPTFSAAGVVNAASYKPGLVAGAIATIFGSSFTTTAGTVQASGLPLPTELAGVSVFVNGIPAPLFAVSRSAGAEQINFQVPWEVAAFNKATVSVRSGGVTSALVEVPLVNAQPEIFAVTRNALGLTLWATGLGRTVTEEVSGRSPTGLPLPLTLAVTSVTINGQSVPVTYSGLALGYPGLYQVNVTTNPGITGDVVLRVGAAQSVPFRVQ